MKKLYSWYSKLWWSVIIRPIWFYTKLKETDWKEGSFSFFLVNCWVLSFFATLLVFLFQYVPIGGSLIEGVKGLRIIIILPTLITLAAVFFLITFLIIGGLLTVVFFALFFAMGYMLDYCFRLFSRASHLNRMLVSSFYSSAVVPAGLLVVIFSILVRYTVLDLFLLKVGIHLVLFFAVLYLYGLWAIAGRKAHAIFKWQAFIGAAIPAIVLLAGQFLIEKLGLIDKILPFIS